MQMRHSSIAVFAKRLIMIAFIVCTALVTVLTTPTVSAQGTIPLDQLKIDFKEIATGFNLPTAMVNAHDGSGRLFVVEKPGHIMILQNGATLDQPFLDISPLVDSTPNERGLLGLAFHPKYKDNGYFYV